MKSPRSFRLTILNQSTRRPRLRLLRDAVYLALSEHGVGPGEVEILLSDDAALQDLNKRMRGVGEATDVLTFPADPSWPGMIGQIAISMDFAERGASARRVSLSEETAFLALHGALHLAGWEDESDSERDKMVQEMNRLAGLVGLKRDDSWSSQPHLQEESHGS